jgi:hypothetical protein
MVIIVLLKLAWIWATPDNTVRRSFFTDNLLGAFLTFTHLANAPVLFLFASDGNPLTATGTGVGVRPLSPNRKVALVPLTAITANFHQTFDVKAYSFSEIAFHFTIFLDDATQLGRLFFGQVFHLGVPINTGLIQYLLRPGTPDTINIGQTNFDSLVMG